MDIRFIAGDELEQIVPLLQTINEDVPEDELRQRLQHMKQSGYRCIGIYDDTKLVGICGIWMLYKHYVGKHLEPDNVVILPAYRGKGLGKALIKWICTYATEQGCTTIELNAYVENEGANRFWKKEGFVHVGHHYQKKLS